MKCDRKPIFCNKCILLSYYLGYIAHVNASLCCWSLVQPAAFHGGANSPTFYRVFCCSLTWMLQRWSCFAVGGLLFRVWISWFFWSHIPKYINELKDFPEHPKIYIVINILTCSLKYLYSCQNIIAWFLYNLHWKWWGKTCMGLAVNAVLVSRCNETFFTKGIFEKQIGMFLLLRMWVP